MFKRITKLLAYVYFFITILAFLSPVSVNLFELLPGIITLWIIYYLYSKNNKAYSIVWKQQERNKSDKITLVLLTLAHFIFYPLYTEFYTGISIVTGINNFLSGISSYALYQRHFQYNDLAILSIEKLPFIIINGILRFFFVSSVIKIIGFRKNPGRLELITLVLMSSVIIFVSFSRGTSFEIFEVVVIWVFAITIRNFTNSIKSLWTRRQKIILSTIFFSLLFFFFLNIQIRMGQGYSFIQYTSFDKDSFVYQYFPFVAQIMYVLYNYFAFGINYTSILLTNFWFSGYDGFTSFLLPDFVLNFNVNSYNYRDIVGRFVNLGTRWNPDFTILVQRLGFPLTVILIIYLSKITQRISNEPRYSLINAIILYYSFYAMFTLPVGNFITASSANMISIFIIILLRNLHNQNLFSFRFFSLK